MKRQLFFTLVLSVAATSAFAGNLTIVSSFPSQIDFRRGLDYAGGYFGYLYEASNDPSNKIMVYDTTGSLIRTIPTVPDTFGIEVFSNGYIYVNTYHSGYVYRLTSEGSVVSSFPGPAYGFGLTYGWDNYYYFASATAGKIYVLTGSGSVVRSFPQPGFLVGGLDFDNNAGNLWISDSLGLFYCNTMGSILDSFVPAPGAGWPTGVCWDAAYVWYHDYNSPGYVYKAQVTFSSIAPASLGRVKALFR